jgi:hypothetical protein
MILVIWRSDGQGSTESEEAPRTPSTTRAKVKFSKIRVKESGLDCFASAFLLRTVGKDPIKMDDDDQLPKEEEFTLRKFVRKPLFHSSTKQKRTIINKVQPPGRFGDDHKRVQVQNPLASKLIHPL